jgi:hypothetical protein
MRSLFIVLACTAALAVPGSAQQKPQTATSDPEKPAVAAVPPPPAKPLVPLKVQLVLSRMKGEKKISSLPYVLGVAANDRTWTNLRMGVDVPIARKGDSTPATGISYRSVGTNIDCVAESTADGSYKVTFRVEDSSVLLDASAKEDSQTTAIAGDMPAFRSFKSNFIVVLRDGQTTQYASAVDPVSGEVMKIDVTLSVIK